PAPQLGEGFSAAAGHILPTQPGGHLLGVGLPCFAIAQPSPGADVDLAEPSVVPGAATSGDEIGRYRLTDALQIAGNDGVHRRECLGEGIRQTLGLAMATSAQARTLLA